MGMHGVSMGFRIHAALYFSSLACFGHLVNMHCWSLSMMACFELKLKHILYLRNYHTRAWF
jgi:hypothetical protein